LLAAAPAVRRRIAALGVVSAGTGCDLARGLALPRAPRAALACALDAPPRRLDALAVRVGDRPLRHAVNIVSTGLSGAVVDAVAAHPRPGRLTYLRCAAGVALRLRPCPLRITLDDAPFDAAPQPGASAAGHWLVAIANGRQFGRGMRVAPQARVDDGRLDVVAIRALPRWQLPWRLAQFQRGRHLHLDAVRIGRGARVTIAAADPAHRPRGEADGEPLPEGTLGVGIVPAALAIAAPADQKR
ncbi:MAG: hypothetical protein AAF772_17655, partial [Acidobacteriota bacterium]